MTSFIPYSTGAAHLGSVDLDRDVVALRRPLGGFGHSEAGADQINTELALQRGTAEAIFNQIYFFQVLYKKGI